MRTSPRRRFPTWLGVVGTCAVLVAAGVLLSPRREAAHIEQDVSAATPTSPVPSSAREKTEAERALERIDANVSFHKKRAEKRDRGWLDWDTVATNYLQRARLTGRYDDYREAEAALARSFAESTDGTGSLRTRAQINFALHRFDRVEADLAVLAGNPLRRDDVHGWAQETRAELASGRGDYAAAKATFEDLLNHGRTWSTLISYGLLVAKTGEMARADALLDEAARIPGPENSMGHAWLELQRGLLDLERGQYAAALEHYRAGAHGFSGWYLIDEHIAEIQALEGNLEDARRAYEDLVRRTGSPEFMDALGAVLTRQGETGAARGWHDRARAEYNRLLATYPEAAYGHALEHFLEFEEDATKAVELAEKNRDLRPGGEAQTLLARAYLKAGHLDAAKAVVDGVLGTPFRTVDFLVTATLVHERSAGGGLASHLRAQALAINPHAFE